MMRRGLLRTTFGLFATLSGGARVLAQAEQPVGAEPEASEGDGASTNRPIASMGDAELSERGISWLDIGEVVVSSGRLRACDPLAYPDFPPLKRVVEPGRYPVRLYVTFGRVAAATLRIADGRPVTWEEALHEAGDDGKQASPFGGYPVDAGMGAYCDAAALEQMRRRVRDVMEKTGRKDVNYYDDVTAEEIDRNDGEWAMHRPMPDSDLNVAMFHSGWGDGFYPVDWGLAEDGSPLVLFTDFQVMENADGRKEPE